MVSLLLLVMPLPLVKLLPLEQLLFYVLSFIVAINSTVALGTTVTFGIANALLQLFDFITNVAFVTVLVWVLLLHLIHARIQKVLSEGVQY